jgi:hypothetical protein
MLLSLIVLGSFICLSIIFLETRKRVYMSPLVIVISLYFIFYIARAIVIYLNLDGLESYFQRHYFNIDHLNAALLLIITSLPLVYIGYKFGITNKTGKIYKLGVNFNNKNMSKLMKVNFIILMIWFALIVYKNSIGLTHYGGEFSVQDRLGYGFPYILSIFVTMASFSFYFIIYVYFAHNIHKNYFIVALVAKVLLGILEGDVLGLFFIILAYVILLLWGRRFGIVQKIYKPSMSQYLTIGTLFFFVLFIVFTFKTISRDMLNISGIQPYLFFENTNILLSIIYSIEFKDVLHAITSRFIGIDTLANIIGVIDLNMMEYKFGQIFYFLLIGLLPRFFIHDKPEISLATWYTDNIWNIDIIENGYQGTGTYIPGEFYLNFGVMGVLIGMLIYGYLLGLIFKITFNSVNKMFAYVFFSSMGLYYFMYEFTFSAWIIGFIRVYIMLYVYSIIIRLLVKIKF